MWSNHQSYLEFPEPSSYLSHDSKAGLCFLKVIWEKNLPCMATVKWAPKSHLIAWNMAIAQISGKTREQSDMDGYLVATLKNRAGNRWTDVEEFSGNYFLRRIKQWWNGRSLEGVSSYLAKEQKLGYSGKKAPFSCFVVSRKMIQSEAESPQYHSIFSEFGTAFFVLFHVSFHFHG